MPTTRIDGIDLVYERSGSGPRVLFCNGSGATLAATGALRTLIGAGVELLAYDQRGLGASGQTAGGRPEDWSNTGHLLSNDWKW